MKGKNNEKKCILQLPLGEACDTFTFCGNWCCFVLWNKAFVEGMTKK